jgi:hypothetical protein
MDAKSLREAMKSKAKRLAGASSTKVDSSDFTPAELLNADVKTGMRPISRRAFKSGGKVEGEDHKGNASRAPRGFSEKVGLANTNQRDANEEREGKKHIGGFKSGGRIAKNEGGKAGLNHYEPLPEPESNPFKPGQDQIDKGNDLMREEQRRQGDMTRRKHGGKTMKADGGATSCAAPDEGGREAKKRGGKAMGGMLAQATKKDMVPAGIIPQMMMKKKKGGMVEGSPKDVAEDKKLAKKHGMSMKEWEKSPEDKKHDAPKKKSGGGLYANIHAKRERGEEMRKPGDKGAPSASDFKASERTARKSGGKVGKTNINIIIAPAQGAKPGMMPGAEAGIPKPPMPAPMAPPPMPAAAPPAHMAIPPGLGAAMAGAAGAGAPPMPGGMPGRPPMPGPMMARKSGGRVDYPITGGAGGGKARKEKVEAYGEKMNKDLKK